MTTWDVVVTLVPMSPWPPPDQPGESTGRGRGGPGGGTSCGAQRGGRAGRRRGIHGSVVGIRRPTAIAGSGPTARS